MLKRKKFLIGGIIIFLAASYLVYVGFMGSATYYYTVSEFMEQAAATNGENVRVNGQVIPGSVKQEDAGSIIWFTIADIEQDKSLPVTYNGVVPDTFKAGGVVVVEGHLNSDGIFEAHTLMPKCASKYVSTG